MGRAKVVVLVKGLGIGGAERLISEAARYWDRDRFDYRVAYLLPWKDQLVPDLESQEVTVDQLGNGRLGPATAISIRSYLRAASPDLVHAHLPSAGILARLLAPTPVVYTEHNVVSSYRFPTKQLNRLTYGRNARCIAVSEAVARSVSRYPGPDPDVVPNGVAVTVTTAEVEKARAELGLSPSTSLIVHVGNIRPHKGHGNLMDAVGILATTMSDFAVVSIGGEKFPGDLKRLEADAGRLDIASVFRLLGRRDDALAFIGAADVVVNPSDHEGLPLVVLEAMSLGKPVVATAVGGVSSVIRNNENGILVAPGDPSELAGALATVATDPALRRRLGGQAESDVLADYGLDRMVKRVEAIYDEVLAQAGA